MKAVIDKDCAGFLVRLYGAPKGAYRLYVTFDATPKTGQRTRKIVEVIYFRGPKLLEDRIAISSAL